MKVYSVPAGVKVPDFMDAMVGGRFDMKKDNEQTEKFLDDLKAELHRMGFNGPLTGEILRYQVADGYAQYMVADAPRQSCLIHLPLGDAWSLPEWQTNGITKKVAKEQIAAHKRFAAIFQS